MDVIYCCYAGAHTSITAAALHVGLLASKRNPTMSDILALPYFDATLQGQVGRVFKFGVDELGTNVYVASLGPRRQATLAALKLMLQESSVSMQNALIVNALSCISLEVRIGGFLSRRLGLVSIGRPMCAKGIIRHFRCFERLVAEARRACHNNP
ncbi:MAG: hypothetical protein FD169_1327 [Bacillota bacterium]|nr:MAG: hypothetical protein FD169_1327 [Bacillota bacterium]MBS3950079.1 DUF3189 family protein [Peptococcaceae bacterium]